MRFSSRHEMSYPCGNIVLFPRIILRALLLAFTSTLCCAAVFAQQPRHPHPGKGAMSAQELSTQSRSPASAPEASDPADAVCARLVPGSNVPAPTELRSSNGKLEVTFNFQSAVDAQELLRYCYVTGEGVESPTLRVNPGDLVVIHFRNRLPSGGMPSVNDSMAGMKMDPDSNDNTGSNPCEGVDNPGVTNLHFHGTNTAPVCG